MQGGCGGNGGLTKVMAMDARLLALVETDTYGGHPGRGGNGGRGGSGVRLFFDSSVTHTHRQLIHITNTQGPGGAGGRKGKRKEWYVNERKKVGQKWVTRKVKKFGRMTKSGRTGARGSSGMSGMWRFFSLIYLRVDTHHSLLCYRERRPLWYERCKFSDILVSHRCSRTSCRGSSD